MSTKKDCPFCGGGHSDGLITHRLFCALRHCRPEDLAAISDDEWNTRILPAADRAPDHLEEMLAEYADQKTMLSEIEQLLRLDKRGFCGSWPEVIKQLLARLDRYENE